MVKLSQDDRQLIHRLVSAGYHYEYIGELLGCALNTAYTAVRKYPVDPDWFPTLEYLSMRVGLEVSPHPHDSSKVILSHPEGVSVVGWFLGVN